MKIFDIEYIVTDGADNAKRRERVYAKGQKEALSQIISKGVPISVKQISIKTNRKVSREYLQQILTAILFNVQSGMSAGKAFELVAESDRGEARAQLDIGLKIIKSGGTFVEAMTAIGFFDKATISILRAGENVGAMEQSLRSAIDAQKKNSMAKKLMIGALSILSLDIFFSVASIFAIQFQLLPRIEKEGITSKVQAEIDAFQSNIDMAYMINGLMTWLTVLFLLVLAFGYRIYTNKDKPMGRIWIDNQLMRVPYMGDMIIHSGVSNTFSIFSTLLKGGVMLDKAIAIVKDSNDSPTISRYWKNAEASLVSGISVAQALDHEILDPSESLIIKSHKNLTQLSDAMADISVRREELANEARKKFGKAAFLSTMAFTSISVLVALWVSYIQYQGMMSGMMSGS